MAHGGNAVPPLPIGGGGGGGTTVRPIHPHHQGGDDVGNMGPEQPRDLLRMHKTCVPAFFSMTLGNTATSRTLACLGSSFSKLAFLAAEDGLELPAQYVCDRQPVELAPELPAQKGQPDEGGSRTCNESKGYEPTQPSRHAERGADRTHELDFRDLLPEAALQGMEARYMSRVYRLLSLFSSGFHNVLLELLSTCTYAEPAELIPKIWMAFVRSAEHKLVVGCRTELTQLLVDTDARLADANAQVEHMRDDCNRKENLLVLLHAQLQASRTELDNAYRFRQMAEANSSQAAHAVARADRRAAEDRCHLERAEEELAELQVLPQQLQNAQQQIWELSMRYDHLQQEHHGALQANEGLHDRLSELEAVKAAMAAEIDAAQKQARSLQQSLQVAVEEKAAAAEAEARANEEGEVLQQLVKESQRTKKQLEKDVENLTTLNAEQKTQLDRQAEGLKTFTARVTQLSDELFKERQVRNEDAATQHAALAEQRALHLEAKERLEITTKRLQQVESSYKTETDQLRKSAKEFEVLSNKLKQELARTSGELAAEVVAHATTRQDLDAKSLAAGQAAATAAKQAKQQREEYAQLIRAAGEREQKLQEEHEQCMQGLREEVAAAVAKGNEEVAHYKALLHKQQEAQSSAQEDLDRKWAEMQYEIEQKMEDLRKKEQQCKLSVTQMQRAVEHAEEMARSAQESKASLQVQVDEFKTARNRDKVKSNVEVEKLQAQIKAMADIVVLSKENLERQESLIRTAVEDAVRQERALQTSLREEMAGNVTTLMQELDRAGGLVKHYAMSLHSSYQYLDAMHAAAAAKEKAGRHTLGLRAAMMANQEPASQIERLMLPGTSPSPDSASASDTYSRSPSALRRSPRDLPWAPKVITDDGVTEVDPGTPLAPSPGPVRLSLMNEQISVEASFESTSATSAKSAAAELAVQLPVAVYMHANDAHSQQASTSDADDWTQRRALQIEDMKQLVQAISNLQPPSILKVPVPLTRDATTVKVFRLGIKLAASQTKRTKQTPSLTRWLQNRQQHPKPDDSPRHSLGQHHSEDKADIDAILDAWQRGLMDMVGGTLQPSKADAIVGTQAETVTQVQLQGLPDRFHLNADLNSTWHAGQRQGHLPPVSSKTLAKYL
eukprot:jgi/Chlat1/5673/Chrsp37S05482